MTDVIAVMAKLQGDSSSLNAAFSSANKAMDSTKSSAKESAESAAKSYEESESRIKESMKEIAGAIGIGFAIDKVVDWGKDTINTMAQMNAASAQTAAVIKSTGGAAGVSGDQFEELTKKMVETNGVTRDQADATDNLLLTFKGIKNGVGEGNDIFDQTAQAAQDMSRAMGIDGTTAALQLGKALNDPAAGMAKLQRSGVTFTAAQQDQIKTMEAAGNTMGAQKIMLAELNAEFGGSGSAYAKSYAGSIAILKNNFEEASVSVMKGFMPAIAGVAGAAGKALGWVAESKGVEDFGSKITDAFTGVWDAIKPVATGLMSSMGPALASLASNVLPVLTAFSPFQIILKGLTPVIGQVGSLVAMLADSFSTGLVAILPTITALSAQLSSTLSGILAAILPVVTSLVGTLANTITQLMPVVTQIAGVLANTFEVALADVGQIIEALLPTVSALITALLPMVAPILSIVTSILPLIASLFAADGAFDDVMQAIKVLLPVIVTIATTMVGQLVPVFVSLLPLVSLLVKTAGDLLQSLTPLIPPILNLVLAFLPFIGILTPLISALLPPLIQLLVAVLTPILALIQPLMGLLVPALTLLAQGLTLVVTWVAQIISAFVAWASSASGGGAVIMAVFNAIGGTIGAVIGGVRTVIGAIAGFVSGEFNTIVSNVHTLGNAFSSVFGEIGGFVSSAFNGAVSTAKSGINGIISVVNGAISALDKVQVTLPGGAKFGIDIPQIPKLATGGTAMMGGLALVGEKGPELVSLPTGASVTPAYPTAEALAGKLGGGGTTINNTFNVPEGLSAAEVAKWVQQQQEYALQAAGAAA